MGTRSPFELTDKSGQRVGNRIVLVTYTGRVLNTDILTDTFVVEDEATWAALNDLGIYRWVNDKNNVAASTVLTDAPAGDQPGIFYDLVVDDVVMLTRFYLDVGTLSDWFDYELGFTDAAGGAGTFTPVTPQFTIRSGAAAAGIVGDRIDIYPPIRVRYADGARSITVRVEANDAAAEATIS